MRVPPSLRITGTGLVAAIGSGLAAVLLSMLTLQRPPVTLAMGCLAPLPLMITVLGFGPGAGAIAVVVGATFVALFDLRLGHLVVSDLHAPSAAALDVAVFVATLGAPALLLGIAARGRALAQTTPAVRPEELLLGRISIIAVAFAAIAVCLLFSIAIAMNGGLDAFNALLRDTFEKIWQAVAERRALPSGIDAAQFARQLTWLMPALISAGAVFFYLVNFWFAARVAQISGLLGVTWPDIPRHLRVPRAATLVLAVSLGLSLVGGLPGMVARVVSAALISVHALQGLAVVHAVTRGRGSRTAILVIVYLSMAALMPWPLLFWGALGLLDSAFSFRDRQKPALARKP